MFGTLSYNGYEFGPLTHTECNGDPVYDEAGRTVLYVRYVFTAKGIAVAEAFDIDANDHFYRIRKQLTEAGRQFSIADKGFGPNLTVNAGPPGRSDINNGPKPRIVSWVPVGHENAVEFVWRCEVCIPECDYAALTGLAAFNYSIAYSINEKGFTTRTVSGYLEIIADQSTGQTAESADSYRSSIDVPRMKQCTRQQQFSVSPDKKRLTFTINDREIESGNAWPEGVTGISGRHRASINRRSRVRVDNTLSVTIELAQNQPRRLAWEIFKSIWTKRIETPIAANRAIMFENLDLSENLFGTEFTFNAGYRVILKQMLQVVTDAGLFESLDLDWDAWLTSMQDVTRLRGLTQQSDDITGDRIVNACNQYPPTIPDTTVDVIMPENDVTLELCNPYPDPDKSYTHFEATLGEDTDYKKEYQVELGPIDSQTQPIDPSLSTGDLSPILGPASLETTYGEAAPAMYWRWRGYAERLGYPIPTPDLVAVDGVTLEKVGNHKFIQRNKGLYFCVPLYAAGWDFVYRVATRPAKYPAGSADPNYSG